MRILHVADTHLGFSAYRRVTKDGINQREMDIYNAFQQFVDHAITLSPDLILHAGDLFDSVRPNNRAITFAIQQLLRLSKKKIPFVVIAGNHEHPKLKETGHIFSLLEHIDHVYPVYHASYEPLRFTINNETITIHALPQTNSPDEFNKSLHRIKPDDTSDYNVLLIHGSVKGIKEFSMNEFNELHIPRHVLSADFDYVALGHYHKYTQISDNVFYAGSTEALTFADAGEQKSFSEVHLSTAGLKLTVKPLSTRPMVDIPSIDCSALSPDEILNEICQRLQEIQPENKILRISLENIPPHLYRSIDFNAIRERGSDALHFEVKANIVKNIGEKHGEQAKIDALSKEFELFISNQNIKEKDTMLKLGLKYITEIEAKEREA